MSTKVAANRAAASRFASQANNGQDKQTNENYNNVAAGDNYDKRPPCRDGEESSYSDCNCHEERNYSKNDADDTSLSNIYRNNINNITNVENSKVEKHMHNNRKRHVRLSECRLPELDGSNVYKVNQYTTLPIGVTSVPIQLQQQQELNGKSLPLQTVKETMLNKETLSTETCNSVNSKTDENEGKNEDSVREYQLNLLREVNLLRTNPYLYCKFIEQECTLGSPFVKCLHDLFIDSDVNADVIEYMRSMIVKFQTDIMRESSTSSNCKSQEQEFNLHTSANKGNSNSKSFSPQDSVLSSDIANSSSNTNTVNFYSTSSNINNNNNINTISSTRNNSNEWTIRHVPDINRKRQSTCDEAKNKNRSKDKKAHKRSSAIPSVLFTSPLALFDGAVNADSKTRLSYLTDAKGEIIQNVICESNAIEQHVHYILEMNEGTLSDHGLCELTREQLKVQYKRQCIRFNSLSKLIKLINEQHAIHVEQSELEEKHLQGEQQQHQQEEQQQQKDQQQQQPREENKKDERTVRRVCATTTTTTTPSTSATSVSNTSSTTPVNSNSILTNTQSKKSNTNTIYKNSKMESKRATTETSHAIANTRNEGENHKRFTTTVLASKAAVMNEQNENATLQTGNQQYITNKRRMSFNEKMQILCNLLVQCKSTCERMQRGLVLFSEVLQMLRQVHSPLPPLIINTGLMLTSHAIMRELTLRSNGKLSQLHKDDNVNVQTRINSPLTCNLTPQANILHKGQHYKDDMNITKELVSHACSNYGYPSGVLSVLSMTDHTSSVILTPRTVVMRSLLCSHMTRVFHIAENDHTNTQITPPPEEQQQQKGKEDNSKQSMNLYECNKDEETYEQSKVQTVHPFLMPYNRLFGCGWVRLMCNDNLDKTNSVGRTIVFLMITSSGFEELRLIHSFPTCDYDALNRIVMERKYNAMTSNNEWQEFNAITGNYDKNINNTTAININNVKEMPKYYLRNSNNTMHNSSNSRKYKNNNYCNTISYSHKLSTTLISTLPSILPISLSRPFTAHCPELTFSEQNASVTQSYCTKATNAGKLDTEENAVVRYKPNTTSALSDTLRTAVIDIHSEFGIRLLYPTEHPMSVNLCNNVACILLDYTAAHTSLTHNCNEMNQKKNTSLQHDPLSLDSVEIVATVTASSVLSNMSLESPVQNTHLTLVQPSTIDENITAVLINTNAVFEEFEEYRCRYSKDSSTWESVEVKVHLFERKRSANNYNNSSATQSYKRTSMQHMTRIELTETNQNESSDTISDRLFTISGFHHIGFVRICITNRNNEKFTHVLQSIPTALRPHIEYLKAIQPDITPHLNSTSNYTVSLNKRNNNNNNNNYHYENRNNNNNNVSRSCYVGWPEVSLSFHNYHATLLAPLSRTITVTPYQREIYFAICLPFSHCNNTQDVCTSRRIVELKSLLTDLYHEQETDELLVEHNQNHKEKTQIDYYSINNNKEENKECTEWNEPTPSDTAAEILTFNNNNNDSKDDFNNIDVKNDNDNMGSVIVLNDKVENNRFTEKSDETTHYQSAKINDMLLEKETTSEGVISAKTKEEVNASKTHQKLNNKDAYSNNNKGTEETSLSSSKKEVKKKKQTKKEKQQEQEIEKQELLKHNDRNEIPVEISGQNKHGNSLAHSTSINDQTAITHASQKSQTNNKTHSKEEVEMINDVKGNKEEEQQDLFSLPLSEVQEKLIASTNERCSLAQMRAVLAELRNMENDWTKRLEKAEMWLNEELLDFDVTHEGVTNNMDSNDSNSSIDQRNARVNIVKNSKTLSRTSSDLVENHFNDSNNEYANELHNREDNLDNNKRINDNSITRTSSSSGNVKAKNSHGSGAITAATKNVKGKKSNAPAVNVIVVKNSNNNNNNNNISNINAKKIKGKELLKWQTNRENMRCKLVHMKDKVNQLRSKIAHVRVILLQKERTSLIHNDKIMRLEKELADLSHVDSLKNNTTNQTHFLHEENLQREHLLEEEETYHKQQCSVELWLYTTSTQLTPNELYKLKYVSENKEQSESMYSSIKIAQLQYCQSAKHVNVVKNAHMYDGHCTLPANVHGSLRMTVNDEELVRWQVREHCKTVTASSLNY